MALVPLGACTVGTISELSGDERSSGPTGQTARDPATGGEGASSAGRDPAAGSASGEGRSSEPGAAPSVPEGSGSEKPQADGGAGVARPPEQDPGQVSPPSSPPSHSSAGNELPPCLRTVDVEDDPSLAAAVAGAQPGDCIVLADGDYRSFRGPISPKGTAEAPIVIRSANKLGARIHGPGQWQMDNLGGLEVVGASHVIFWGLTFPGYSPINIVDSKYCRITRCKFVEGAARSDNSEGVRIDHNDFGPKRLQGHQAQAKHRATNTRIDHNYFHDVSPGQNGRDTVTLGCCGPEIDYYEAKSILENNLFVNCRGEAELISVKSSGNIIRYNTILDSAGTVTFRGGRKNTIHGNFIIGGSGIRIYDEDHLIYNNYVEVGSALQAVGGGSGYATVRRAVVVHNTFVGGVRLGGPDNLFASNIVTGGMSLGGARSPGNLTGREGLVRRGMLLSLGDGARAIDAGGEAFPFVMDDLDGQPRSQPDVGADEWSTAPVLRRPLTRADVGPDAP